MEIKSFETIKYGPEVYDMKYIFNIVIKTTNRDKEF
jgi:hypothetical protein